MTIATLLQKRSTWREVMDEHTLLAYVKTLLARRPEWLEHGSTVEVWQGRQLPISSSLQYLCTVAQCSLYCIPCTPYMFGFRVESSSRVRGHVSKKRWFAPDTITHPYCTFYWSFSVFGSLNEEQGGAIPTQWIHFYWLYGDKYHTFFLRLDDDAQKFLLMITTTRHQNHSRKCHT